tara:strand:+ start:19176 stop:19517 length:342 start_codon:yes stop_codon:yes gene_type:complete
MHTQGTITREYKGKEITVNLNTNEDGSGQFYKYVNNQLIYELEFRYYLEDINVNLLGAVDDFNCMLSELYYYDAEGNEIENIPNNIIYELQDFLHDTLDGWVEVPEDDHAEWI